MSRHWLKLLAATKQPPRRATQRSFRPHVEAMESRLVPSQFFEAEGTATLGGIGPYFDGSAINDYPRVEDSSHSGHTGHDGCCYVNLAYSDDSTITWDKVPEDQAGDYTVAFRYSMDMYYTGMFIPARPMGLMVNGKEITRALNFTATGDSTLGEDAWSIWADLPVTVHLNAGVNTIELFATGLAASGANPHVDSMTITPVDPGVLPDAPAYLTVSAGVGTADLYWEPSAIATSYNIYRATSSGDETLVARGVTAPYFFDTDLAGDGTSYFYQVSAVNAAGESAPTDEASATPSAPAGLLFSDDFSNGPSSAWIFTPEEDYWLPQVGQLTDAMGDTTADVPQTASVFLPKGTGTWQADLLTREGYGAGVDQHGNPGMSGISVQSSDGSNAVFFSVFADFSLNVGTTVNGEWQGWTRVGIAAPVMHRGGPEMLWHTYAIQLDADGTFSLFFDGNTLRSGIQAGSAAAWADGIGVGTLFTLSNLDNRHLSTYFDNVRALGLAGAPHTAAGTGHSEETLIATAIGSPAFADFGLNTGTTDFHRVTPIPSTSQGSSHSEVAATARALVWAPVAPADLSGSPGAGHRPGEGTGHSTPLDWEMLMSPWWALQELNL